VNYSTAYNHTCVSVRLRDAENSARSAIDRYCRSRNFLSSASSCCVVNGVRGFRFVLCLRRRHFCGVNRGGLPNPRHTNTPNFRIRNINSRQPNLCGCGCGSTHRHRIDKYLDTLLAKYSGGFTFYCRYGPCGSTHLEYTLPTDVVAANSLSAFRRLLKRVFLIQADIYRSLMLSAGSVSGQPHSN